MKLIQKLILVSAVLTALSLVVTLVKGTFELWDVLDYGRDFLMYGLVYLLAGKVDE